MRPRNREAYSSSIARKNINSPLIQLFFSLKILATNSYLSNVTVAMLGWPGFLSFSHSMVWASGSTYAMVGLCDVCLATLCLLGPTCSPQKVTIDSALIETFCGREERISNDHLFHSRKGVVEYFGLCDVVVPHRVPSQSDAMQELVWQGYDCYK
ncbi:uncharacterized protein ARMOST_20513 [Armillaria ostoyae]|uniref:Uncharacterized protein n=1 Tax=Armillaria ostoyae TaxID=47428 RepID=A0A284S7P2_ARMOS|nr:uncharacterized protein ARMOST_20513 [Armillaria ostoyae]